MWFALRTRAQQNEIAFFLRSERRFASGKRVHTKNIAPSRQVNDGSRQANTFQQNAASDLDSNSDSGLPVSNWVDIQVPELFKRIRIRRRIKE